MRAVTGLALALRRTRPRGDGAVTRGWQQALKLPRSQSGHQQLDAVAANVGIGLGHRAEHGREVFTQGDAVKAGDADVLRHPQASQVRGAQAADGVFHKGHCEPLGAVQALGQPARA